MPRMSKMQEMNAKSWLVKFGYRDKGYGRGDGDLHGRGRYLQTTGGTTVFVPFTDDDRDIYTRQEAYRRQLNTFLMCRNAAADAAVATVATSARPHRQMSFRGRMANLLPQRRTSQRDLPSSLLFIPDELVLQIFRDYLAPRAEPQASSLRSVASQQKRMELWWQSLKKSAAEPQNLRSWQRGGLTISPWVAEKIMIIINIMIQQKIKLVFAKIMLIFFAPGLHN